MSDPAAILPGVLLIGAGRRGAERAAATVATRRLRLVGVYDVDPGRAAAVARRHRAVALVDLDSGLESRGVDAVIVATPAEEHARGIGRVLRAGKRVLAEAPIATRARDARALARRAAAARVELTIG